MNVELFRDLLEQIENIKIRKFTEACLKDAPDYLNTIPASVSGKYHPIEATKEGGLVWHIRRACYFGNMFFKSFQWNGNPKKGIKPDIRSDIVLSALILHDIGKKKSYGKDYWAYVNHPVTASKMISKHKDMLPEKVFKLIDKCVKFHMGPWTPKNIKKDMTKYNICELITYQSDYLSAQKTLQII